MRSLQVSKVTSGPQILCNGPCWFHGFVGSRHPGISGCTLTVSDSATQATVGSTVDWCYLHSGSSVVGNYYNAVRNLDGGVKMTNGLRAICAGWSSGVTILVHWS